MRLTNQPQRVETWNKGWGQPHWSLRLAIQLHQQELRQHPGRTHARNTRHNTPGITARMKRPKAAARKSPRLNPQMLPEAPIVTTTPNSERISFFSTFSNHRIISQEAVNLITQRVWDTPDDAWTPKDILVHSPTEQASMDGFHEVDTDHFYAAVVHPDTRETITQY